MCVEDLRIAIAFTTNDRLKACFHDQSKLTRLTLCQVRAFSDSLSFLNIYVNFPKLTLYQQKSGNHERLRRYIEHARSRKVASLRSGIRGFGSDRPGVLPYLGRARLPD